MAELDYIRDL
uniref:Uncharacterized protein n=1 Tax=Anguilla anguilla TaxID=7936 RepID=A0A0E9SET3_ANGAN